MPYIKKGMKHLEQTKTAISKALKKYLKNPKNKQERINQLKKIHKFRKGKTWEEIYGKEKAEKMMKIQKLIHKGEKSANWKGGVSSEYYEKLAKENLKQECKICGSKKQLIVHHIDKNSQNNNLNNLMMICKSHHAKIHNRIRFIHPFYKQNINLLSVEIKRN